MKKRLPLVLAALSLLLLFFPTEKTLAAQTELTSIDITITEPKIGQTVGVYRNYYGKW